MTHLRPLLESSADELERALLLSVQREAPGRDGLRDTALALGLGASAATALTELSAAAEGLGHTGTLSTAAVGAKAGIGATALSSAPVSIALVGKYIAGGALVSLMAIAGLDQAIGGAVSPSPAAQPVASVVSATKALTQVRRASPATVADAPRLEPTDEGAERAAVRSSGRATPKRAASSGDSVSAAASPEADGIALSDVPDAPPVNAPEAQATTQNEPAKASSLAAELRLLDRARAALNSGDAQGARRLLDQYTNHRPSGILAQEAALLRVQLLLKLGQQRAAAELARQIIRENPESRHVESLRRLAAE